MHTWDAEGALDRADGHRASVDWVADQWRRPGTRLLWVTPDRRVATTADATAPAGVAPEGDFDSERHLLLGLAEGVAWFAAEGEPAGPTASLRHLGAVCAGAPLEIAVGAVALLDWHRLEPHCSACGTRTRVAKGGASRCCPGCSRIHFPRQDPAVIVAVLDPDDRILLGRQSRWDPGRMSVLAGFVEAGESLEQAVHREVAEESGVRLESVRYVGSQPWPFPRSLMLGFVARTRSAQLRIDRTELEMAEWFTRDGLTRELRSGSVTMPGAASIAHELIVRWRRDLLPI